MDNPFTKLDPVAKAYKSIKTQMPTLFATIGSHSAPRKNAGLSEDWKDDEKEINQHMRTSTKDWSVREPHEFAHNYVDTGSDEEQHIDKYTEGSTDLNYHLHKTKGNPTDPVFKHQAEKLDTVFKHKTSGDIHVYSGLHKDPGQHFKNKNDDHVTVHHPAFLSTSTSLPVARAFAAPEPSADQVETRNSGFVKPKNGQFRHVLKLHIPTGSRAVSVSGGKYDEKDIKYMEHEVLVQRGAHIKIHRQPTHVKAENMLVWHGELVGHSFTADGDKLD